jgi:hypothetical protein
MGYIIKVRICVCILPTAYVHEVCWLWCRMDCIHHASGGNICQAHPAGQGQGLLSRLAAVWMYPHCLYVGALPLTQTLNPDPDSFELCAAVAA